MPRLVAHPPMSITQYSGWGNQSGWSPSINSYRGSIGTTTAVWGWQIGYFRASPIPSICRGNPMPSNTTGLFTLWNCYGIRDATDGTSNTIAFAESLCGDPTVVLPTHRNNAITGVTAISNVEVFDASTFQLPNRARAGVQPMHGGLQCGRRQSQWSDRIAVGLRRYRLHAVPDNRPTQRAHHGTRAKTSAGLQH